MKKNISIVEIADTLSITYGIQMAEYSNNEKCLNACGTAPYIFNTVFEYSEIKQVIKEEKQILQEPKIFFNDINCGWIGYYDEEDDKILVTGPVLLASIRDEMILKAYHKDELTVKQNRELLQEYHQIPVFSFSSFLQIFTFAYRLLTGKKFQYESFGVQNDAFQFESNKYSVEETYQAQQRNYEIVLTSERRLLDCIQRGDMENVLTGGDEGLGQMTALAPDETRSVKTNMIVAITLATRASISAGLAVEIAYPLSDRFIVEIEQAKELKTAIAAFKKCIYEFTRRNHYNKFKLTYSKRINRACGYIIKNYDQAINLQDLAEELNCNPDYLSRQFRKETGKSVSTYIREVKIDKAKSMIMNMDKTLTEVAGILGYSNQGQFIKDFKRETGVLPHVYKQCNQ